MKNSIGISSSIQLRGKFNNVFTDEEIKNEPMFFNCSMDFAYDHAGPITQAFMDSLPEDWTQNAVIDTRSHMLMKGWYPCIPGWHHDDVPRPEIPVGQHFATAGQPDYDNMRYKSEHILGLVNADICPTVFAIGECDMPPIQDGDLIYRAWHKECESLIAANKLKEIAAQDRRLYYFDNQTFHTGTKATGSGWRWFGRVSKNTDRTKKITNEIRHQVQVYLEFPMQGW